MVRGEAYFRVEKDKARPFYVEANGVQVRAVGTAFSVQMQTATVEVVVKEGAVDVGRTFSTPGDGGPVRVDAGSKIVVPALLLRPAMRVAGSGSAVPAPAAEAAPVLRPTALTEEELDARLAWRIPRLVFEGMPLAEAIALLNRHNTLQIVLADPSLGALRVSGNIRSDNPEGFVSIAQQTLELAAERVSEREIVLRPVR
jgi:transmembrane sensor